MTQHYKILSNLFSTQAAMHYFWFSPVDKLRLDRHEVRDRLFFFPQFTVSSDKLDIGNGVDNAKIDQKRTLKEFDRCNPIIMH